MAPSHKVGQSAPTQGVTNAGLGSEITETSTRYHKRSCITPKIDSRGQRQYTNISSWYNARALIQGKIAKLIWPSPSIRSNADRTAGSSAVVHIICRMLFGGKNSVV
jgi:hypothetical protein